MAPPSPTDDEIEATAAQWFTRAHGGLLTPAEAEQLQAWRAAHPQHEQAYRAMERIWGVAEAMPDAHFAAIVRPQRTVARRRLLAFGGLGLAAALGAALWLPTPWSAPTFAETYLTQRGERRTLHLPDGSQLVLNTDTRLAVRFSPNQRHIALEQGQVLLQVASDATRPFTVTAGDTQVTVTGTVFDVRRDAAQVSVAVLEGRVEVREGPWWRRQHASLTAGLTSTSRTDDRLQVTRANVTALTAWRQGKAVFDSTPLREIVAEMNRYLHQPIVVRDPELQAQRLSGVFSVDAPDQFLEALPGLLPVMVMRRGDGRSEIVGR